MHLRAVGPVAADRPSAAWMLLRHGITDDVTHSVVTKGQRGGPTRHKGTDRWELAVKKASVSIRNSPFPP